MLEIPIYILTKNASTIILPPEFARLKVPLTSPASENTQNKAYTLRLKIYIGFYKPNKNHNRELYKFHLLLAFYIVIIKHSV
jgi:hypothetical protein